MRVIFLVVCALALAQSLPVASDSKVASRLSLAVSPAKADEAKPHLAAVSEQYNKYASLLEASKAAGKNLDLENQIRDLIVNTLTPNVVTHHASVAASLEAAFGRVQATVSRFTSCSNDQSECNAISEENQAIVTSAQSNVAAAEDALVAASTGSLVSVTFDFASDPTGAAAIAAATAAINAHTQTYNQAVGAVKAATDALASAKTSLAAQLQTCVNGAQKCNCDASAQAQLDVKDFQAAEATAATSQKDEQEDIKTFAKVLCLVSGSGDDCSNPPVDLAPYTYKTYTVPTIPSVSCSSVHHYCAVVKSSGVVNGGAEPRLFSLDAALNALSTPNWGQSQLVCQITNDGKVMDYPSDEDIKKGKGWWWDTNDIAAMHNMCKANANCMSMTTPVLVDHYCAVIKSSGLVAGSNGVRFATLDAAKAALPIPPYGQSQLVCQITNNGQVLQYPTDEAIKGNKGWWWDTYDIQAMHNQCANNAECMQKL